MESSLPVHSVRCGLLHLWTVCPFLSAVRSSLQSVPTGLPAKSSHYGKNGPAENLRWHLSSQKQVSDKEREPVFPDEFSDGEIMTTTRNYFRKKSSCAGVYWRKWELFAGGKPASMEHMNYLVEQSAQRKILSLQQVFAIKYCQKIYILLTPV